MNGDTETLPGRSSSYQRPQAALEAEQDPKPYLFLFFLFFCRNSTYLPQVEEGGSIMTSVSSGRGVGGTGEGKVREGLALMEVLRKVSLCERFQCLKPRRTEVWMAKLRSRSHSLASETYWSLHSVDSGFDFCPNSQANLPSTAPPLSGSYMLSLLLSHISL